MATIGLKANEEKLNDDFDDFDFDFDDFNVDVVDPKDDRHPVMKVIAPVGRGVKDYITKPTMIEKFVKAALPSGYGQAYDMGGEAVGELRQLYNSAAEEIEPVKEISKKLLRKALPSLDGKIPKKLKEKLEEYSKEKEQWQSRRGDAREEQLGSLLTSIFEQNAQDQVRQQSELNEREKLKQGFEQIRHRDQISQLDAIRLAVESQAQFQNKVTFNVQRKQLEMSYRMFWAMADLNKEQKRSNAEALTELRAMRKNTGLPDYVKQTGKERFRELLRNKFLENTREGMFGGARDYFRRFTRNLSDQALGQLRGYTSAAEQIGSMGEVMSDTADGMGDMMPGFSARDEAIQGFTSLPMDFLAEKAAAKANKLLAKSSKLRRGGGKAAYLANTSGDRLHEYLTSYDRNWGSLESLREMLASAAPSHTPDSRMETDSIDRMHEPMPFSRSNKKSLDEVIPGLLARIHREIKILRTGNEDTELITYDFLKNRFSTDKKIASDLRQRITGVNSKRANAYADQILDKVDRSGKLTAEQREKAKKELIEKSVMGKSIDISNIHSGVSWGGDADGQAIADRFKRYLRAEDGVLPDNNAAYNRQLDLISTHRNIAGGVGDPRVLLQQLVNAGQLENLKEMGILDAANNVDRKRFAKWLAEGEESALSYTPAQTQSGDTSSALKRRRKLGRRHSPAQSTSDSAQLAPHVVASVSRYGEDMVNELRTISAALTGKEDKAGGTVEKNVQTITDLLTSLDGKYTHAADANYSVLTAMLQRLGEISSGSSSASGGSGGISSDDGESFTSLWEHFKSSGADSVRRAKTYAKMVSRRGMRLWSKYTPKVFDRFGKGISKVGDKLKDLSGSLSVYYGDVVVSGETLPRLRAVLLKAGEYRDKLTGRVITSLEDITGDVIDSSGNVVITLEEFYNSYVTGNINKRVRDLFTNVKSYLEDWKARLHGIIPETLRNMKSRAIGVFNIAKQALPPYDVYVKTDMTRPLLYANMMRHEMYYSQRTGNVLTHPRLIDGPVIDQRGNVLVSEEHIKDGLVDVDGDPVGKGLGRLLSKGTRKVTQAWEVMRNAAVGVFGAIGKGLGNVSEYFKNFFAPFADMITNSRKTVDLLQLIHDMLDARLPVEKKVRGDLDGDGIRDGSVEDLRRKREKRQREEEEGAGEESKDAKFGKGVLGALLSDITGFFKRKKHEDAEDEDGDWFSLDDAGNLADIYDAANGDGYGKDAKSRRRAAKARLKRMRNRNKRPGILRRAAGKIKDIGSGALGRAGRAGIFNTGIAGGIINAGESIAKPLIGAGSAALGGAAALGSRAVGSLSGSGRLAKIARGGMFNTGLLRGAANSMGRVGKMLPYAGKLLGPAAAAYGAYSAYDNLSQGNYGMAALDAGLAGAGVAGTAGGVAGVAGYGGAILGGLGSVLTSPFLIPAAAAIGIGALGYMVYKHLKKTKLTNLSKIRVAQYGVNPEDKDGVEKVFGLETLLEQHATLKEDGTLLLNEKELDLKEVAELFSISRDQDMQLFNLWYRSRFVPVFRRWLIEIRKISPDAKLANIERVIPGKDKLKITEDVVNSLNDSYDYMVGWSHGYSKLAMNGDSVRQLLETTRILLMKEGERDGGEKAVVENRTAVASTTTGAAALAEKALTDKANYTVKDGEGKSINVDAMGLGDLTEKIKSGSVTVSVAVAVPESLMHKSNKTLDALTSIRYKAYGLTHMTADKARTFSALEMLLSDYLGPDTESTKLSISLDNIQKVVGEVFGIPTMNGEHATRWKVWFNGRFLPVFLLWASTIRKKTGKDKLKTASDTFPLEDQLSLGRAIIGATGINVEGGRVSVWKILTNPFADNYELNDNPDSTAGNMEAIRQLADKVRLGEMTASGKEAGSSVSGGSGRNTGSQYQNKGGVRFEDLKSGVRPNRTSGGSRRPASTNTRGVNATGDTIVDVGKDVKPLSGIGDVVRFSSRGGGNYTDLAMPTGAGWPANRELLLKAAAMAGIDPGALITTVAVESSFNPDAAPQNPNLPSSAKGLGQHLDSSWMEDLRLHGKKFGIPNGTTQFDARASALMTASRLRYNGEQLQKSLGRSVTMTDLYLAHLMGLGGASKFLKAPADAIGAEVATTTARQHPEYFYENGKALTVKEVYAKFAQKLAKRPAEFGVTDSDMRGATSQPSMRSGAAVEAPTASERTATTPTPAMQPQAAPASQNASYANTPSAGTTTLNQPIQMEKGKAAVMGTGPAMVAGKGIKYELILQREDTEEDGTYGTLRFPDGTTLNTLELPWKNNEARVSCIPPGIYSCKKRPSRAFGEAYEVQKVQGRTGILIHAGNSAGSVDRGLKADSRGCILLGMDRGRKGSQKVITASKHAMNLFYEKMADRPFTLVIRGSRNAMASTEDQTVNLESMRKSSGYNASVQGSQTLSAPIITSSESKKSVSGKTRPGDSIPLPLYNTTDRGVSTAEPSKKDMERRDIAMSSVIAPKIDGIANTLSSILGSSNDGVVVLREILGVLKSEGKEPRKTSSATTGKAKPETTTRVPVPQRRSF